MVQADDVDELLQLKDEISANGENKFISSYFCLKPDPKYKNTVSADEGLQMSYSYILLSVNLPSVNKIVFILSVISLWLLSYPFIVCLLLCFSYPEKFYSNMLLRKVLCF